MLFPGNDAGLAHRLRQSSVKLLHILFVRLAPIDDGLKDAEYCFPSANRLLSYVLRLFRAFARLYQQMLRLLSGCDAGLLTPGDQIPISEQEFLLLAAKTIIYSI